ncbi:MAG TPA: hypothetical protein VFS00_33715, partial [Polyangiaceae bacterium]|nr:hypothetical protein [Polyangiaceae bacterium]
MRPAQAFFEKVAAASASVLRAFAFLKLGAWTIFLAIFPFLCLLRGRPGFAVLLAGFGLALDLTVYRPMAAREGFRRGVFGGMVTAHVLMIAIGAYAMTRPVSGGWRPLPGSEQWADSTVATGGAGRLFVLRSASNERGAVLEWGGAESGWSSLKYEGAWGWGLSVEPSGGALWVLPRGDHEPVGRLALDTGRWASYR